MISLGCELGFIFVEDALFADLLQGFNVDFPTLERKHGVFNFEVRLLGVFLLGVVEVSAVQDGCFQLSKPDKCLSSTIEASSGVLLVLAHKQIKLLGRVYDEVLHLRFNLARKVVKVLDKAED